MLMGCPMMACSVLGLLAILLHIASSMKCPGCSVYDNMLEAFNDKAVTDFLLNESGSVLKLVDCVSFCYPDIRCRTYRYNAQRNTCSTYGTVYTLPENTINSVTSDDGSRLYSMCGMSKSFASSCSSNNDCDFANSSCLLGICSCTIGYSYDVLTGNCIAHCGTYSKWFALYLSAGVVACNNRVLTSLTQQQCMEACRDEDSFTCINAEYNSDLQTCQMCDTTWFDLEPEQRIPSNNGIWVLYNRHCGY